MISKHWQLIDIPLLKNASQWDKEKEKEKEKQKEKQKQKEKLRQTENVREKERKVNALTKYRIIASNDKLHIHLIEIELLTGKWHQIRRHLPFKKFFIVNDRMHGNKRLDYNFYSKLNDSNISNDLQLHSYKMQIYFDNKWHYIYAPLPTSMTNVVSKVFGIDDVLNVL